MSRRIVFLLSPIILSFFLVVFTLTAVTPPTTYADQGDGPAIHIFPTCGTPDDAGKVLITLFGSEWPDNKSVAIYWNSIGNIREYISMGHGGFFTISWLENALTSQTYEIIAVSNSTTVTTSFKVPCTPEPVTVTHKSPLFTGLHENGSLENNLLHHYGPYICTSWGDPYSPLNSIWNPDYLHTYQYRIRIPADYPDDTLRVELFDPDSINQPGGTFSVTHSAAAINNGFSDIGVYYSRQGLHSPHR